MVRKLEIWPQDPGSVDGQKKNGVVHLTANEHEVLVMVAAGHDVGAIAEKMNIPRSRVDYYYCKSFMKLDVSNRFAAVLKARNMGIIDPCDELRKEES